MTIPIPGVRDIVDGISAALGWFSNRKEKFFLNAWKNASMDEVYKIIMEYYSDLGDCLFSYPQSRSGPVAVPLYVAPGWDALSNASINMHFRDRIKAFQPTKSQEAFWDFYARFKKDAIGKEKWPLYDADIFRLVELNVVEDGLDLTFELGKFPHTVMCQYVLEHEVITLLAKDSNPEHGKFKLRNSVAGHAQMIASFFEKNVARIGICNLILLRVDKKTYVPVVQKRSKLSMVQQQLFDPVSSCIFEVATAPKADFALRHTVLREIYEELFGNPDIVYSARELDPYFFYKKDGIADLIELIRAGSATFEVTGFCIDLIRIVPEISTVLIVRDEGYYRRHYRPINSSVAPFRLNPEFGLGSLFQMPSDLSDVDEYLMTGVVANPDGDPKECGFDPMKWTLPGGFSFYQGLRRAVEKNLL